MRSGILLTFVVVSVVQGTSVITARSEGCEKEIVIPVEFAPNKKCWYYRGIGTTFKIQLESGQSALVRMLDESERPLTPEVVTPNGQVEFDTNDHSGELEFRPKQTGVYSVVVAPCALWGDFVRLEICAG